MKTPVYLDYAAATPMREEIIAAMLPFFSEKFHNPSAIYLQGQETKKVIESARTDVASCLGVRPSEIIFTAGGTEANNLAIRGIMQQFPQANVVTSKIEHDSVLQPASQFNCKLVAVYPDGRIDETSLKKHIDAQTVLVSIGHVNNEIGTIQPLKSIAALLNDVRTQRKKAGNTLPLYLHTDACQSGNYLSLKVNTLGVDLLTLNGGKIYGPKQSGALYVRAGIDLKPLILGGGQEWGKRSGTENVASIVGFARALTLAQAEHAQASKQMSELQTHFMQQLEEHFPNAVINGPHKHRIVNNVHVTFPRQDNERLMMALDERGIQCAVGSACSASKDEPSHVLHAIGLDESQARASLRFSMGSSTDKAAIDHTVDILKRLLA